MAEENPLEQMAKNVPQAPQQKAEEQKPKPIGTLENVVNETWDLAKVGAAVAAPFTFASQFPHMARDAYVLSGTQIAGDATTSRKRGQAFTKTNLLESSLQGIALTPLYGHPTYGIFPLINRIPTNDLMGYATKGALWAGVAYPFVIGTYQIIDYLIKNRKFTGLGKYLKENYWSQLKKAWKTLLPFSLLNIFFAPLWLQVPIGAALSYGLALFGAPKREEVPAEKKRDPTPYLVAAPRVAGRLAYEAVNKLVYNPLKALYEIGSNFYKATPKPTPPAQEAAGAKA